MCNEIAIPLKFVIRGIDLYIHLLYSVTAFVMYMTELPESPRIAFVCFVILSPSNLGLIPDFCILWLCDLEKPINLYNAQFLHVLKWYWEG